MYSVLRVRVRRYISVQSVHWSGFEYMLRLRGNNGNGFLGGSNYIHKLGYTIWVPKYIHILGFTFGVQSTYIDKDLQFGVQSTYMG